MEAMARRIQVQLIALFFCLVMVASGQSSSPNILVSYGFDDVELATGPDTFAVFARSRGTVRLNSGGASTGSTASASCGRAG